MFCNSEVKGRLEEVLKLWLYPTGIQTSALIDNYLLQKHLSSKLYYDIIWEEKIMSGLFT